MFGIATRYTKSGMRIAENSFAHHLKPDLQGIGKQIETLTESTIREGGRQLQLALRLLGDLHIRSASRSGNGELGAASLQDLLRPGPAPQEFQQASIAGSALCLLTYATYATQPTHEPQTLLTLVNLLNLRLYRRFW